MIIKQLESASSTGKMAYLVLCLEGYLLEKMPERDWTPILEILWQVTSSECCLDLWSDNVVEIIPSLFFETPGYQDFDYLTEDQYRKIAVLYQNVSAAWEDLVSAVQHAAPLYANGTRGCCEYADEDVDFVAEVMRREGVPLPDVDIASLSPKPAHGEPDKPIDAAQLSRVLDYQP